jgi:hypothetical protein
MSPTLFLFQFPLYGGGENESSKNIAVGMKPVLLLHCTYSYSLLNRKMLAAKVNLNMLIVKTMLQYGTSIACYVFENQKVFSSVSLT